jgi:hypothetical protein
MSQLLAYLNRCQGALAFEHLPDFDRQGRNLSRPGTCRRFLPVAISLQRRQVRQCISSDQEVRLLAGCTEKIQRHCCSFNHHADQQSICLLNRFRPRRSTALPQHGFDKRWRRREYMRLPGQIKRKLHLLKPRSSIVERKQRLGVLAPMGGARHS